MAVHPIVFLPDPVLRQKAKRVPKPALSAAEGIDASIHRLIEDMMESMYAANGVGLAAPQIGVSLRVIVIGLPDEEPFALINPEIVKRSGERILEEGCLSIPGYRTESLVRSVNVVAKGIAPTGKPVRIKAKDDLLAEALEHEIDHINGILYIDHLESMDQLVRLDDEGDADEEPEAEVNATAQSGGRS